MNIIFALTLVYDFMHFQFKSDVYEKNTQNEIKLLNIANRAIIVPNLNMQFLEMCLMGRKSLEQRRAFFLPRFAVSYIKAHGKPVVCREPHLGSRQKLLFAESLYFLHEPFQWHTANQTVQANGRHGTASFPCALLFAESCGSGLTANKNKAVCFYLCREPELLAHGKLI